MLEPCRKPSSKRSDDDGEGVERYNNGPTSGEKLLRGFSAYILDQPCQGLEVFIVGMIPTALRKHARSVVSRSETKEVDSQRRLLTAIEQDPVQ